MSVPVELPAGVTNLESKNAKIANWREAHLVRWDNAKTMRPIPGWEKQNLTPFPSAIRKMHRWVANSGIVYTAYLCEDKCFVDIDGVITDISPVPALVPTPTNVGGYGDYIYGAELYGTPRPGPNRMTVNMPIFSMDNWGQELRVMTSPDGRYLGWDPTDPPGTLLTPVTDAPTNNRSFVITPERHAMLFGMNADNKFGWSDEEDDTNWDFGGLTSRARFYDIYPKAPVVTQQLFEGGIIMWTPPISYIIEWVGLPYVYSYRPLGRVSVPLSPAAVCETPQGVVWFALDGWWIFDGTVPRVIPCAIWDYIFKHINVQLSRFNAACVHLTNKGEVWLFYTSKSSPDGKNDKFAVLDYRSLIWTMGNIGRTCGFVYANEEFPEMSDGVNVWKHESGFNYPGAEYPWVETQNLNVTGGENFFTLKKILPDVSGDIDALRFRTVKTNRRAGYVAEEMSPQRKKNGGDYIDIRETARDMRLRIEMVKSADWGTVGPILMDGAIRGKK